MNNIIGYYTTRFGEIWNKSLKDLMKEALNGVLENSQIEKDQIDAIFFGNMLGGIVDNMLLSGGHISEMLETDIPVFRTEAACASGGVAFHIAHQYLQAHTNKTVIVLGAEKMTDISSELITKALASAASIEEQEAGLTFPGLYAMLAQVYMDTHNYSEEHLAWISVKNHDHGRLNEKAHFRRQIPIEKVMKSGYIAYPLKVLDCSPISDGASAIIISNKPKINKPYASIVSSQVSSGSVSLANRQTLDGIPATQNAAKKAFKEAQISPSHIDVAELHDCFTIAEILAMEDVGFCRKGEAGQIAAEMGTKIGSGNKLTVNTSGGLKSSGHPVGATGIKQLGEIYLQLTGQAGGRQVQGAQKGLAHNVGGSGGTAVITILAV